ncbi:MAG TPA: transcriptional regulator [Pseudonocardia sp.]|nr:transcriptional regulator [Pseudonocardia sp.]
MSGDGRELLLAVQAELAPRDDENRLAPLIAAGEAPRSVFGVIAAEELQIVPSDWRSLLTLAARSDEPASRGYFGGLAAGEQLALATLGPLAQAADLSPDQLRDYEPRAGCQAYPSYFAWLALNAAPAEVAVAITANFAAWGRYCADIAGGMREHYGFAADAMAFFEFFAEPLPDDAAVAAIQAGLDAGTLDTRRARRYARLFQSYELMFWNTLAEA